MSSSTNGHEVSEDEPYAPELYARGGVSRYGLQSPDEPDSDSCGMWERGHPCLLEIHTRQGEISIPYHGIAGLNHWRAGQKNRDGKFPLVRFSIKVRATLEWPGAEGEVREHEGYFRITVVGDRLDYVMRHIRMGTRTTLHESGAHEDEKKPVVTEITMAPFVPAEMPHPDDV